MNTEHLIIFATGVAFLSGCWYAFLTAKGSTQPNRVTYVLWFMFPAIIFLAQVSDGLLIGALPTLAAGIPSLATFCLSYANPRAYWHLHWYSYIFAIIGSFSILLWIITDDPMSALTVALIANSAAFLPTLIKAYIQPSTEDFRPYALSALAFLVILIATNDWTFMSVGFIFYLFVANTSLALLARR